MMNLKNILLVNGASTALSGAILLVIPQTLSALFGVSDKGYFIAVGLFFAVFGGYVFRQALGTDISRKKLRFITITDWLWVLLSVVLIISLHGFVSVTGLLIIGFIAFWVALMAFLEGRYI